MQIPSAQFSRRFSEEIESEDTAVEPRKLTKEDIDKVSKIWSFHVTNQVKSSIRISFHRQVLKKQHGTCRMILNEDNARISGKYWTSSNTTGDIDWIAVDVNILDNARYATPQ